MYVMVCDMLFCFFFKQKSAYEMRMSDWSSDVCSSDLTVSRWAALTCYSGIRYLGTFKWPSFAMLPFAALGVGLLIKFRTADSDVGYQIGRASCRERVCQYV